MKYNSPLMKFLETIANMLIVSFFWLVCSLPVVTIVPSSAALYHTTCKVIFGEGKGKGVTKDFFASFKQNFVLGLKCNVILIIAVFFIIVGDDTARQIYTINIFGTLYLILAMVITFVFAITVVYLPAVLSKFYLGLMDTIRLSAYFASQNLVISVLHVALLGLLVLIVDIIPIALLIVPALYVDLIRPTIEKRMTQFIKDNNLEEYVEEEKEDNEDFVEESFVDIDQKLSQERRKKGK